MDKFENLKIKLLRSYYQETFDFMKARLSNSTIFSYDEKGEERKRTLRETLKSAGFNVSVVRGGRSWISRLKLCGLDLQMFCKCDSTDVYLGLTLHGHCHLYMSIDRNLPTRLNKLTKAELVKMLEIPQNGGSDASTEWYYMPYNHRRKITSVCLQEDSDIPLWS